MQLHLIAHRGIPALYPENTLISFKHAAHLPVDAIELDVHLSRDKQLVVLHDATIDRTSNGQGQVADYTLAELRNFDFGGWKDPRFAGEKIPTLEETVAAIHDIAPNLTLLLEVKENNIEVAAALLAFVRRHNLLQTTWLCSFHYAVLDYLHRSEPAVRLHGNDSSAECDPGNISRLVTSVGVRHSVASRERVAYYQERGIRVDTWVINDAGMLQAMIAVGTDSITSNYAHEMCRLLGRTTETAII